MYPRWVCVKTRHNEEASVPVEYSNTGGIDRREGRHQVNGMRGHVTAWKTPEGLYDGRLANG